MTNADLIVGNVRNNAFSTGGDGTTSNVDTEVIPHGGTFDLSMNKVAATADFAAVGDDLFFTITFTNNGDVVINPARGAGRRDR